MARRILVTFTTLVGLALMTRVVLEVIQPPVRLQNWPDDPEQVARYMVRTFWINLILSVGPYLLASFLMDWVRPAWRYIPVVGMGVYVLLMLPEMSGSGPYMGMISWVRPLHVLQLFGFPALLVVKWLWYLLEPGGEVDGRRSISFLHAWRLASKLRPWTSAPNSRR